MAGLAHAAFCKHAEVVEICSDMALSLLVEAKLKVSDDTKGAEEALALKVELDAAEVTEIKTDFDC